MGEAFGGGKLAKLPLYRCHKVVRAAEIAEWGPSEDGEIRVAVLDGEEARFVTVPRAVFARHAPQAGDFLVVYEDGYVSVSPRQAFLDGYSSAAGEGAPDETVSAPVAGAVTMIDVFAARERALLMLTRGLHAPTDDELKRAEQIVAWMMCGDAPEAQEEAAGAGE